MENNLPLSLEYNNPFMLTQFNFEGVISRGYPFYKFSAQRYGLRAAALTIVRLYFKKEKVTLLQLLPYLPLVRGRVLDCAAFISYRLHVDKEDNLMLSSSDSALGFLRALLLQLMCFVYGDKLVCDWYSFESMDFAVSSAMLDIVYKYHK